MPATRRRLPRKRTLLDVYSPHRQHPAAAVRGRGRGLPLVRRPPRRPGDALPRVRRPQARAGPARLRRPAPVLAGAGAATRWSARCWRRASTTCWWTSTRTSTACRSTIVAALCAGHRELTVRGRRRSRPSTASARRSPEHMLAFRDRFPDATVVTLERELPLDDSPSSTRPTSPPTPPARRSPARCARARAGGEPPELVCVRRRGQPGRGGRASACCAPARPGSSCSAQAVLVRASHHSALLELELAAPPRPVREVRRAALPRGRAREGLPVAAAAGGQPARRAELVPRAPAPGGRRARARPAGRRPARQPRRPPRRAGRPRCSTSATRCPRPRAMPP